MKNIKRNGCLILALIIIVSAFCVVLSGCGAKSGKGDECTTESTAEQATQTQQSTTQKKDETTKKETEVPEQVITQANASNVTFEGDWSDLYSQRAHIRIEKSDNGGYKVKVSWSSSAFENTTWDMNATLSANGKELSYSDCVKKTRTYTSEIEYKDKVEYNNGSGTMYIKDGKLYWNDKAENIGKDTSFTKI